MRAGARGALELQFEGDQILGRGDVDRRLDLDAEYRRVGGRGGATGRKAARAIGEAMDFDGGAELAGDRGLVEAEREARRCNLSYFVSRHCDTPRVTGS